MTTLLCTSFAFVASSCPCILRTAQQQHATTTIPAGRRISGSSQTRQWPLQVRSELRTTCMTIGNEGKSKSRRIVMYAMSFTLLLMATYVTLQPKTKEKTKRKKPAAVYNVNVLETHPHDMLSFTQGLAKHVTSNSLMYESTGKYSRSTLRLVQIESGNLVKNRRLEPSEFGEGLALLKNKYVIQLLWKTGNGYVYDAYTLDTLSSFSLNRDTWGVTVSSDDKFLYVSDGTCKIHVYDICNEFDFVYNYSFTVVDGEKQVGLLNELEVINDNEIWANVLMAKFIARINIQSGAVIAWLDLRNLLKSNYIPRNHQVDVLNGIAYYDEKDVVYVTGKYWPKMFAIRVGDTVVSEEGIGKLLSNPFFLDRSRVDYILKYVIA